MPDEILIINGPHTGEPIGRLTDPDGNTVLVWSDSGPDLVAAMIAAIGPIPQPPQLGLGGSLQVASFDAHGFPASYIYNPAGDEVNTALAAMYASKVSAWNARAATIQEAVKAIIAAKKP